MNEQIRKKLMSMQDLEYRDFNAKLIPTVDKDSVIGVRTPDLRKYAKELLRESKKDETKKTLLDEFLSELPHKYYEENNLHAFILEGIKDFDKCVQSIEKFLPFVDNWATCDCMSPGIFKKNTNQLLPYISKWISSKEVYTVRFGIGMLMRYFLDDEFNVEYLDWVAAIRSDEYYINMMIAWYFATAFAKQYDASIGYVENERLDKWTHNKAIQKALESNRVSVEHKEYLKKYRIK